jgi:hypothetical protein
MLHQFNIKLVYHVTWQVQKDIMQFQIVQDFNFHEIIFGYEDRLCGLVVRVSGYRSRGPRLDSRPYQISEK